jgi:hypothetical protein
VIIPRLVCGGRMGVGRICRLGTLESRFEKEGWISRGRDV